MRYMEYFCKETKLKLPIVTALAMLSVAIVASSINNHASAQTGSMNELMNMTLIATGTCDRSYEARQGYSYLGR